MKSKRRKKSQTRSKSRAKTEGELPTYCTQCGATLDGFGLSGNAEDLSAIRRNFEKCKKKGRFTGEFCSKLFIASPVDLDSLLDDLQHGDEP